MAEEGLVVPRKRSAKKFSTCVGEVSEAPPNLVDRDFAASAPNEKWLTDITEMRAADGKVYLSPIVFVKTVVSWVARKTFRPGTASFHVRQGMPLNAFS